MSGLQNYKNGHKCPFANLARIKIISPNKIWDRIIKTDINVRFCKFGQHDKCNIINCINLS